MEKVNSVVKQEMIRRVSKESGVTQDKTETVLDAFYEVIAQVISEGQGVNLIGIGKIEPKYMEGKPERDVFSNLTKETIHKEAEPPCYRVRFRPSEVFLNRLKEDSYNNQE